MALTRQKKEEIVEKVKGIIDDSESVVFVNFNGLAVPEANKLRTQLKAQEVGYFVTKKTLAKRALSEAKIDGETPPLDGELALAYGEDLLSPAREIHEFQKSQPDNVKIIGGIFDGRYMSREEMEEIALIPPREVLLGKLVNVINSPIQGLVTALDAIAEKKQA